MSKRFCDFDISVRESYELYIHCGGHQFEIFQRAYIDLELFLNCNPTFASFCMLDFMLLNDAFTIC